MGGSPEEDVPLGRYFAWFTGALLVTYVAIALVRHFFGIDGTGVSLITPFFAAMIAGEQFLLKEKKVPNGEEKRSLVLGGLGIFLMINALFLLLAAFGDIAERAGVTSKDFMLIFAGMMIFALIINYFLMRWAYGGMLKKRAEKLGYTRNSDGPS